MSLLAFDITLLLVSLRSFLRHIVYDTTPRLTNGATSVGEAVVKGIVGAVVITSVNDVTHTILIVTTSDLVGVRTVGLERDSPSDQVVDDQTTVLVANPDVRGSAILNTVRFGTERASLRSEE